MGMGSGSGGGAGVDEAAVAGEAAERDHGLFAARQQRHIDSGGGRLAVLVDALTRGRRTWWVRQNLL